MDALLVNDVAAARSPSPWALALGFAVIYTTWGTTYMAIKLGVRDEHLPPLLFGGARIFLGGLLLWCYQWLRGAELHIPARDVLRLWGIGLSFFVAGNGFIGYGQKTVDSSLAAVLVASTPLWIGLFATLWPHGERLTPRGWIGLIIGLLGVVVLLAPGLITADLAVRPGGVACVLASAMSWAFGSVALRHVRLPQPHLTVAACQMLMGGASMLLAGASIGEIGALPQEVTTGAILVFCYLLVVGSLGGFIAYNWLLGHVSAAKVGTYAYVNPLVAVLIGWSFGETVSWLLFAGMGVILFGVFLVRGGERHGHAAAQGDDTGH